VALMGRWYTRPVFHSADVAKAIDFYVGKFGFTQNWRFDDDVAQVGRGECEIILSNHWPDKAGKGMLFIELIPEDYAALPAEFAAHGVTARQGWWGYRAWIVTDPDGNEIYFPDPDDPGGGKP
jgi:catechol 2,3-dioxygenase-like lactoylglutathione lyase family enzyme